MEKLQLENAKLKHEMEHQNRVFQQQAEELDQEWRTFMAEKKKVILLVYYWNMLEIYVESGKPYFLELHLKM